jgi:hypothetical protein
MKVKIVSGLKPYGTKIEIDGHEIKRISSVKFDVSADTIPRVILSIAPDELEIEGDAEILKATLQSYSDEELLSELSKRFASNMVAKWMKD